MVKLTKTSQDKSFFSAICQSDEKLELVKDVDAVDFSWQLYMYHTKLFFGLCRGNFNVLVSRYLSRLPSVGSHCENGLPKPLWKGGEAQNLFSRTRRLGFAAYLSHHAVVIIVVIVIVVDSARPSPIHLGNVCHGNRD